MLAMYERNTSIYTFNANVLPFLFWGYMNNSLDFFFQQIAAIILTGWNRDPLGLLCPHDGDDMHSWRRVGVLHSLLPFPDIEVANRHGHTCLMIACYKGRYIIADYLIKIKADVNRKSVKGNTALHDCAESGSLNIMKLLLDNGAKIDVDSYGKSRFFFKVF